MLDSIRTVLHDHPFGGVGASMGGYVLSLSEMLSQFFRFLILFFSNVTAISVAYVQYNKARSAYGKVKNPSKKGDSNTG